MIKINLHKNLSDFSPLRRYPRKIAFFTNKLYISDVYHIFLNRRDVKAYENQCFVWSLSWYRYVKFQALAHGQWGIGRTNEPDGATEQRAFRVYVWLPKSISLKWRSFSRGIVTRLKLF